MDLSLVQVAYPVMSPYPAYWLAVSIHTDADIQPELEDIEILLVEQGFEDI